MDDYKHSVSVLLVENMNRFERGQITKAQLLTLVDSLADIAVDVRQAQFFEAYKQLVDKVEKVISRVDTGD